LHLSKVVLGFMLVVLAALLLEGGGLALLYLELQGQPALVASPSTAFWLLSLGLLATVAVAAVLGTSLLRALRRHAQAEEAHAQLLERERATRHELEERQALLDLLVEQSSDALILADAQGMLRVFNAEAERQHGVTRQQVAAPDWVATYGLLTMDGSTLPLEKVPLYRALQGEKVTDGRWMVKRPDGSLRICCGTATPLRRPDGSIAGAMLISRDETERLALEQQRAETLAMLDALLASSTVGLAIVDPELRYLRVNELLARMSRKSVAAHLRRTVREVHPADADRLEPLLRRVLETGEAIAGQELTYQPAPPEPPLTVLVNYFPVRSFSGRVQGVGIAVADVTPLKKAEEQLRRGAEFRERFLGIVGHDLRGPLNSIHLSACALADSTALPERDRKMAQRIVFSAERMVRMIVELLDFARSRLGGGMPVDPRPGHLEKLCRQVVEELEASHPGGRLSLQVLGSSEGRWDAGRLAQVFSNLVGNALQYSPEGSPIRVTLDGSAPDVVEVAVHNHGPAIAPELLAELFNPFRRGVQADTSSLGGLGLGLYIVQQIVIAHGGSVHADSRDGQGTTFTVRLPRRGSAAPSAARPRG
jgi:PAS domain S-box-containing protein